MARLSSLLRLSTLTCKTICWKWSPKGRSCASWSRCWRWMCPSGITLMLAYPSYIRPDLQIICNRMGLREHRRPSSSCQSTKSQKALSRISTNRCRKGHLTPSTCWSSPVILNLQDRILRSLILCKVASGIHQCDTCHRHPCSSAKRSIWGSVGHSWLRLTSARSQPLTESHFESYHIRRLHPLDLARSSAWRTRPMDFFVAIDAVIWAMRT